MRKTKLLALLLSGSLFATPAFAGWTQIVGTGLNGAIANGNGSGGLTQSATFNTAIPAGSFVVLHNATRQGSFAGISACIDSQSNSYTPMAQQVAPGGAAAERIFWTITTAPLSTSDTATCTHGNTATRKYLTAVAWSGQAASPVDAAGTAATGSSNISVGPTGTPSGPGGTNSILMIASAGFDSSGDIVTGEASGWTTFSSGPNDSHAAFKLVSSNVADSYTPSPTGSHNWAVTLAVFDAAAGGGISIGNPMSLTGVQ